jgi:hypothetical protein
VPTFFYRQYEKHVVHVYAFAEVDNFIMKLCAAYMYVMRPCYVHNTVRRVSGSKVQSRVTAAAVTTDLNFTRAICTVRPEVQFVQYGPRYNLYSTARGTICTVVPRYNLYSSTEVQFVQ